MERINAAFTGWIHTYAEQYNWFHARWRSRPDGTLWRLDTPLSTIQQSRIAPCPDVAPRIRTLLERAADGSLSFCTT
jgi:hypothetical protein